MPRLTTIIRNIKNIRTIHYSVSAKFYSNTLSTLQSTSLISPITRKFHTTNISPTRYFSSVTESKLTAVDNAKILKMIIQELEKLKSLTLMSSTDCNDTVNTIDAIIKNINFDAPDKPLLSTLAFAYSRLQAVRHSAELLHGIDIKSDTGTYKEIKKQVQPILEMEDTSSKALDATNDANVIDPPADNLQKEKELNDEQEKLRENSEFLALLHASNLHTIHAKKAAKKIFISYAWPGQPRWYTDEEMDFLLKHYCKNNQKIIPIQRGELHWALIYTDPINNVFLIDPLVSEISPEIKSKYPNATIPENLICKEKSYDAGAWLVEIARLISEQDKLPDTTSNISEIRENHAKIVNSLNDFNTTLKSEKKPDEAWTKEFIKHLAIHLTKAGFQVYLDELHSCDGYPLAEFMKKIKEIDHVLFISTRTMGHKLQFKESGVRFELKQALAASAGKINNRFLIPILLNNAPHYAKELKNLGLAETCMCQDGYFNALGNLINRLYYGVNSREFNHFWLDTWFIENIKKYYLSQNKIEILAGVIKPMDIDNNPIHLTLMSEEEQKEKEHSLYNLKKENLTSPPEDRRLVLFENLHKTTTPITVENIFDPHDRKPDEPIKRISAIGNAGAGKSTLCQHISYLWAKIPLWNNRFRLLIWISLRELVTFNDDEATLSHYIARKYSPKNNAGERIFTPEQIRSLLEHIGHNNVLFVLDGADEVSEKINEAPEKRTKQGDLIRYLFSENMSNVIITSRPYREEKYIYSCPRKLVVAGFSDNAIDQYVERYFQEEPDHEKYITSLKAFLKKNRSIKNMAHTPLNLMILCLCWKNRYKQLIKNTPEKITLASLYEEHFSNLSIRYLQNKCGDNPNRTTTKFILNHPRIIKLKTALCQLAFNVTEEREQIVSSEKINLLLDEYEDDGTLLSAILNFGLLKPLEREKPVDQKSYYFIHPTFQEFLAAMHWVARFTSKDETQSSNAIDWLKKNRYNASYYEFWRFTAGLLISNTSDNSTKIIEKYLSLLFEEDSAVDICFKLSLWIQGLCEIKNDDLTTHYTAIIKENLERLLRDYPDKKSKNYSLLFSIIFDNSYILPYLKLFEIIKPIISTNLSEIYYENDRPIEGIPYLSPALTGLLSFIKTSVELDIKNLKSLLECYSLIFNERVIFINSYGYPDFVNLTSSDCARNAITHIVELNKKDIDFRILLPSLMYAVLHFDEYISFQALEVISKHTARISQIYNDPTNEYYLDLGCSRQELQHYFTVCLGKAYLRHPIKDLEFYINTDRMIIDTRYIMRNDFLQRYQNIIIEIILKINSPLMLEQITSFFQNNYNAHQEPWSDRAKQALENLAEKKSSFSAGFFGTPQHPLCLPITATNDPAAPTPNRTTTN